MSFDTDAETLSLFTSIDFELDDDDACQKICADDEFAVAGSPEDTTDHHQTDNSDERSDEDEEDEEEESAASLVHSVEPATGKFFHLLRLPFMLACVFVLDHNMTTRP